MTREKLRKVVISVAWSPGAIRALVGVVLSLITGLALGWDWVAAQWPLWALVAVITLDLLAPVPTAAASAAPSEIALLKFTMNDLGAFFNDTRRIHHG